MRRKAKIVATIGPASASKETIHKMVEAGMDVARLNFSHGTYASHKKTIQTIRQLSNRLGRPITILQDLQGPKIRTGKLANGPIELIPGESLCLAVENDPDVKNCVELVIPDVTLDVKAGTRILLSDGHLELVVKKCAPGRIDTEIVLGGTLKSNQGIHIPGMAYNLPGFTEKDEEDLAFGLENGVDMIAMSFIRTPQDVSRVRSAIARMKSDAIDIPIIAKLERQEALDNLIAIVHIADGVMVARGDLGIEMAPESVPIAQKRIIEVANRYSKIVITATQMLESMIKNPRPTRAEASDIANAIFDGSDAVMLSGETAVGKYPVKTIEMMSAIVQQAEENLGRWGHHVRIEEGDGPDDEALYLTRAGAELARDRMVAGIAVFTKSGSTARLMSKARPDVPILAFTSNEKTYQRMGLFWDVVPHLVPWAENMEQLLAHVESALLAETPVERGQQVVLICGFPVDQRRPSNLIMLHTVGQHS